MPALGSSHLTVHVLPMLPLIPVQMVSLEERGLLAWAYSLQEGSLG